MSTITARSPQPGDWLIARAVFRKTARVEGWRGRPAITEDEILEQLQRTEITDLDLADTFGPQWDELVVLIRRAAKLTRTEENDLEAAQAFASRDLAWDASRDAGARAARRAAIRNGDIYAAAWGSVWLSVWPVYWRAARSAAWAVSTRDLIGQNGYTREHYDVLMGPWLSVIGGIE